MPTTRAGGRGRKPLNRERVLEAALRLADEKGLEQVSMRKLGEALRVEAMSLYKHVRDKEDILDGIADLVMAEVEIPSADLPWKEALRRSAVSVHAALLRHPWAPAVFESRITPGPARLAYLEAVIAILRRAGFDLPGVARAFMALDSQIYGFALQEAAWPFDIAEMPEAAAEMTRGLAGHPNLLAMAELAMTRPGALPPDFEFSLGLVLDGLERSLPRPT